MQSVDREIKKPVVNVGREQNNQEFFGNSGQSVGCVRNLIGLLGDHKTYSKCGQ